MSEAILLRPLYGCMEYTGTILPYTSQKTLRLPYKDQPTNAVSCENHMEEHKYTIWTKCVV